MQFAKSKPREPAVFVAGARRAVHPTVSTSRGSGMSALPADGLVAIVKRDCETCVMTAPVLGELARRAGLTVYSQDDASFPDTVPGRLGDLGLDISHHLRIEIVPTLIR